MGLTLVASVVDGPAVAVASHGSAGAVVVEGAEEADVVRVDVAGSDLVGMDDVDMRSVDTGLVDPRFFDTGFIDTGFVDTVDVAQDGPLRLEVAVNVTVSVAVSVAADRAPLSGAVTSELDDRDGVASEAVTSEAATGESLPSDALAATDGRGAAGADAGDGGSSRGEAAWAVSVRSGSSGWGEPAASMTPLSPGRGSTPSR